MVIARQSGQDAVTAQRHRQSADFLAGFQEGRLLATSFKKVVLRQMA